MIFLKSCKISKIRKRYLKLNVEQFLLEIERNSGRLAVKTEDL